MSSNEYKIFCADMKRLGIAEPLFDENRHYIGWSFLDYFPKDKNADKVFKYMKKYGMEAIIYNKLKRECLPGNDPDIIIDLIDSKFVAGEPFALFALRNEKKCEIFLHFGCASVNFLWLFKQGLSGFHYVAKVTHAGSDEEQKKRARVIFEYCQKHYF